MIFGHYSFCIKKLYPNELPFELNLQPDDTVELRVRVVHILFIPIFPFDKIWIINPGHGDKVKLNDSQSRALDRQVGRKGVPWYSFIGLILLILLIPGYHLMKDMMKKNEIENRKSTHALFIKKREERIKNPMANDFYQMYTRNTKGLNNGMLILKTEDFSDDSIGFKKLKTEPGYRWSGNKEHWQSIYSSPMKEFEYFKVAKADLLEICDTQYTGPGNTGYRKFVGKRIEAIDSSGTISLYRIYRFSK